MKKAMYIICLTAMVFLVGCGDTTASPEFTKYLIYSPDMDVNITYSCDENWDKKIEKVEIPNALDGMSCSFYEEDGMHEVELGIAFEDWDEETGIGEDFTFNEIAVTWDDGTCETYDIGSITIADMDDEAFDTVIQTTTGQGDEMVPENGSVLRLVKGPDEEILDSCFRKLKVNGTDIEEYRESEVTAGNNEAVSVDAAKRLNCLYDVIDVYLEFEQQGTTDKEFAVHITYGR